MVKIFPCDVFDGALQRCVLVEDFVKSVMQLGSHFLEARLSLGKFIADEVTKVLQLLQN